VGFSSDIVVGVFIGFDDNRPLGRGETGATGPVPVFTEFMQTALRERPARPFVRPRNAIFRTVNGIEEAFRPGTERRREEERAPAQEIPTGPRSYNEVIRREREEATGQTSTPAAPPPPPPATPPPPKKEPAEDLSGLY
jgi:penicillin-binding protein 1A